MLFGGNQGGQGKVLVYNLACHSLNIGKWARVNQKTMDLVVFYSPEMSMMTYYTRKDQAGYKIEYHLSAINNIYLENRDGYASKFGEIVIELNRTPNFFKHSSLNSNHFRKCPDFTDDQQATQCFVHHLGGNAKVLSRQLAKLNTLESFMNRHNSSDLPRGHQDLFVSAPVSSIGRPSLQPNLVQPGRGLLQESCSGVVRNLIQDSSSGTGNSQVQLEVKDDEIFTDSGYASVVHFAFRPNNTDDESTPEMSRSRRQSPCSRSDEDETGTICSAVTNIVPNVIHESIAQVCNDIYNNLRRNLDDTGYKAIANRLPGIIKAFAVKIGTDASNGLNPRIMHFVYQHHR